MSGFFLRRFCAVALTCGSISRRRRPGEPRQGYVKLDVKKPWETLGDVIESSE